MSQLLSVRGGRRLEGEVTIQGAKNSVLPILAATLLARGQVALLGCPRLRDVDASHPHPAASGLRRPLGGGCPGGGHHRPAPL